MIAYASSLDQGGLIAHTAEDLHTGLGLSRVTMTLDSTSAELPVPDYTQTLNEPLKGKVIGIPKQFFDDRLDSAMHQAMDAFSMS